MEFIKLWYLLTFLLFFETLSHVHAKTNNNQKQPREKLKAIKRAEQIKNAIARAKKAQEDKSISTVSKNSTAMETTETGPSKQRLKNRLVSKKSRDNDSLKDIKAPVSAPPPTQDEVAGDDVIVEELSFDKYFESLHNPDFIYGRCDLVPDRSLTRKQQTVRGSISFRQQLQGGVTEMYVNITGLSRHGSGSRRHALHVHSFGDLSRGCQSTGDHYNPFGTLHGGPLDHPAMRHFGDLGNIEADVKGAVRAHVHDHLISLLGPFSALGRSVVVHSGEDDLGTKRTTASLTTGSAGRALACCVIGLSDSQQWPRRQPEETGARDDDDSETKTKSDRRSKKKT